MKMNGIQVFVGDELFRFTSFEQWVNKAVGWALSSGVKTSEMISVDAHCRLCPTGKEFMRARDEGAFPVVVYRAVID